MTDDARLVDYYAKRASEYERIYEKPERQNDLEILRNLFRKTLAGRNVLEIACGTGYWTQVVAQTANQSRRRISTRKFCKSPVPKLTGAKSIFKKPTPLILIRHQKIILPPDWPQPGGRICGSLKSKLFLAIFINCFRRVRCWFSWTINLFQAATRPSAGPTTKGTHTRFAGLKPGANTKFSKIFRTKTRLEP